MRCLSEHPGTWQGQAAWKGIAINLPETIDQGVEYLTGRGFKPMRREWAMGTSLFAFAGNSKADGFDLSQFGLYIYQKDSHWFVVVGQGQETGFPTLGSAVLFAEKQLKARL
jgi:hypothetical protein